MRFYLKNCRMNPITQGFGQLCSGALLCVRKRFFGTLYRLMIFVMVFVSVNVVVPMQSAPLSAATDSSIDFDAADEVHFTQEDATNGTDFEGGALKMHNTGSGYTADVTAEMTNFTLPSPNVVTQSANFGSDFGWKAFDNSAASYWFTFNQGGEKFLTFDFGSGNTFVAARITLASGLISNPNFGIKDFIFYGSNDNSNFDQLTSGTHTNDDVQRTYSFDNERPYRYYKITVTDSYHASTSALITDMQIMEDDDTFPTSQAYYTTTADTSQLDTTPWTALSSVALDQDTPTNTSIKYLVSFDDRATWKYWTGSAWAESSLANLQTNGNSKATLEGLSSGNWSSTGGFSAGSTNTLDFAIDLNTTDANETPRVFGISVTHTISTATDTTLDFDVGDEGNFIQEDASTGTDFIGDQLRLTPVGPSYGSDEATVMTGFTTPSPNQVFESAHFGSDFGWGAFDDSAGTQWYTFGQAGEKFITYDFGAGLPRRIERIQITPLLVTGSLFSVKDWIFYGSNDNSNFTQLATGTHDNDGDLETYDFTNTTYYRYYKLTVTDSYHSTTAAGVREMSLIEKTLPTAAKYVTTSDSSQLNTSTWTQITSMSITQTTPGSSTIKYLVSFDDRTTWKYFNGTQWSSSSLGDLQTNGMTKTQLEDLTPSQWKATGGFQPVITTTLDFAIDLKSGSSPLLDGMSMEYSTEGSPSVSGCHSTGTGDKLACVEFQQSRLKINTPADHTIFAQTLNGMSAGGAVKVTYASGYDLTGLGVDDIDLGIGDSGVCSSATFSEKTLAASPSGSTWGVSIDTGNRIITITSGTDTISADRCVRLRVGTNAVTGSTGNNQITNPSSAGSYIHSMSVGTATDTGNGGVPIVDDDQVTVSAVVSETVTFDIDVGTTSDADSSAAYTVALGALSTGAVATSGDGSINQIGLDVAANASNGVVVDVKNANGANGLVSTSITADDIDVATGTLSAGSEGYGICVHEVQVTNGTFRQATSGTFGTGQLTMDGSGTAQQSTSTTCTSSSHEIGSTNLSSSFQTIFNTNTGAVAGGRGEVFVKAAIDANTSAHDDYTDTLTFRATPTF